MMFTSLRSVSVLIGTLLGTIARELQSSKWTGSPSLTDDDFMHPSFDELFRYHAELQAPDERENIDIHLLICGKCRAELDRIRVEHPDPDDLELLAMNRLPVSRSNSVKLHLARCNRCLDALALVSSRITGIREALRNDLGRAPKPVATVIEPSVSPQLTAIPEVPHAVFVDASLIFNLTAALRTLAAPAPRTKDVGALRALLAAHSLLGEFLKSSAVPAPLRRAGADLEIAMENALVDVPGVPVPDGLEQPSNPVPAALASALQTFESTLTSQMDVVFFKDESDRAPYLRLVPRLHFDPTHWLWLPPTAQRHWTEATLCISIGLSTAAVFHVIRAAEAVTGYYLSKLRVVPLKNDLLGNLELLKENGAEERALSLADQLAVSHSNPVLDSSYFPVKETAIDIFELGRVAIRRLLRDMEKRGFYFSPANSA